MATRNSTAKKTTSPAKKIAEDVVSVETTKAPVVK